MVYTMKGKMDTFGYTKHPKNDDIAARKNKNIRILAESRAVH